MTKNSKVLDLVKDIATPIASLCGVEIVDLEYVKEGGMWFLRIFIDTPEGITVDDCERVSKELDKVLDERDLIKQQYHLEVSSPGLARPLKTEKDFLRFSGQTIKVKTYAPINKQKNFQGVLTGIESGVVLLDVDGGTVNIPLGQIAGARLVPDLDW